MELPFKLYRYHEIRTKCTWKYRGLIARRIELNKIYQQYIYCSKCEICQTEFKNSRGRLMIFNKETGKFKHISCKKCAQPPKNKIKE